MSCIIRAGHIIWIWVYSCANPARVRLLTKGCRFNNLSVSYPHYYMTIFCQHVTLANARFRNLWNVIFDCSRRLIRKIYACRSKHLNHKPWAIKSNRSLRLEVYSWLATRCTIVIHVIRCNHSKSVSSSRTTNI